METTVSSYLIGLWKLQTI